MLRYIFLPIGNQGKTPAHCGSAVANWCMTMNYFVLSGFIRAMHKISAQATATCPILVQIFCAPDDKLMAQCRSDTYEKLARFLRLKIPVFSLFNLIVIF